MGLQLETLVDGFQDVLDNLARIPIMQYFYRNSIVLPKHLTFQEYFLLDPSVLLLDLRVIHKDSEPAAISNIGEILDFYRKFNNLRLMRGSRECFY